MILCVIQCVTCAILCVPVLWSPLTLQYSSMGISRFTATSRMWLRRNRIFPETPEQTGTQGQVSSAPFGITLSAPFPAPPLVPRSTIPKKPTYRLNTSPESGTVQVARTFQGSKEETAPSKLHPPGLSPVMRSIPHQITPLCLLLCKSGLDRIPGKGCRTSLVPLSRVPRSSVGSSQAQRVFPCAAPGSHGVCSSESDL